MIKAVFFDIDGTLTVFGSMDIPEDTKDALRRLKEEGVRIFVATGRYAPDLDIVRRHGLPFDGYVIMNGQAVLDADFNIVYANPITEDIDELVSICNEGEIPLVMTEFDRKYTNCKDSSFFEFRKNMGLSPIEVSEYRGKEIYLASAFVNGEQEEALLKRLPNCKSARWNERGIDIVPKKSGKVVGIQRMLDHFGIKQTEMMAFGDGGNDIEMIRFAEIGVAMGNASEKVKQSADFVTKESANGGVLYALEKYEVLK